MAQAYSDAMRDMQDDYTDTDITVSGSKSAKDREQRELRISLYAEQHEDNLMREMEGLDPVPFTYLDDEPPDNFESFPERLTVFRLTSA